MSRAMEDTLRMGNITADDFSRRISALIHNIEVFLCPHLLSQVMQTFLVLLR